MSNVAKLLNIDGDTAIQTLQVTYAAGTTGDTKTDDIEFDSAYDEVLGVALLEITDGDLVDDYRIGLFDNQSRELISMVPKVLFETSKDIPQLDKFMPLKHDIKNGATYKWKTEFTTTLASDSLEYYVAFLLHKKQ